VHAEGAPLGRFASEFAKEGGASRGKDPTALFGERLRWWREYSLGRDGHGGGRLTKNFC